MIEEMSSKQALWCFVTLVCIFSNCEGGKTQVVKITDQNWAQTLEGEWLIKFYAPWCPACKAVAPTWNKLSEWSKELEMNIAEVDVTEEPGLSGRFMVTSLPTIYHAINGEFRRYLGPRTEEDFISLVEDEKYLEIETVPGWQSPNSILMSLLSWVFKISMLVRVTHTILTEEYGFPTWSSYGFFAVITVMLGLLLGMILVFIADCFWPINPSKGRPRPPPPPQEEADPGVTERKKEEEEEEEEKEMETEKATSDSAKDEVQDDQTVRQRKPDSQAKTEDGAS